MLVVVLVSVVCRRGDIQQIAYRFDPVFRAQGVQQWHYFFPESIELCIREISRGLAQDIIAAPDFKVHFFQPLTIGGDESCIALLPAYPDSERLGGTTNLLGNGTDNCPLRAVLIMAFKNHACGTVTRLGENVFSSSYLSLKEFSL